jgi:hypothetical protein
MRPTIYRGLRLVTITEHVTASNDLPWFEAVTITENVTASNDIPWYEAFYYYREC